MPILGACMGGETSTIAAGSTAVSIVFTTEDGRNLNGSVVTLSGGPETYTATLTATGRVSLIVASGYSYTAHITPAGGKYSNLNDQTFFAESMGSIAISFVGLIMSDSLVVTFAAPINMSYARATLQITSPTGITTSTSLTGTSTVTSVTELGEYTYSLTYLGASVQGTFSVDRNGSTVVDLATKFINLTVTVASIISEAGLSPTIAGAPTSEVGSPAAVLSGGTYTISATGTIPEYSNGSVLFNVVGKRVTPTSAQTVSVGATANHVIITEPIDAFRVPLSRNYNVMLFGGGGGGAYGGGGGGHMAEKDLALSSDSTYPLTIGSGGTGREGTGNSGGASSFGTLLSASGGGGAYYSGGHGGSGGGGVSGNAGGNGSYGGGGGGGSGVYKSSSDTSWDGGAGGKGGPFGGGGGGGGDTYKGGTGGSGKDGIYAGGARYYGAGGGGGGYSVKGNDGSTSGWDGGAGGSGANTWEEDVPYKGSGYAGYGGNGYNSDLGGGGGGGGGYGGDGGNGGNANHQSYSGGSESWFGGGGGGGGGYGGDGGNGGSGTKAQGGGGGGGYGGDGGSGRGGDYGFGGGGGGYGSSGYGGSEKYASGGNGGNASSSAAGTGQNGGAGVIIVRVIL